MAKKSIFAWKPTRDLMKNAGGLIVERDAVDWLNGWLEDKAKSIVAQALKIVSHDSRKKLTRGDLELVDKMK